MSKLLPKDTQGCKQIVVSKIFESDSISKAIRDQGMPIILSAITLLLDRVLRSFRLDNAPKSTEELVLICEDLIEEYKGYKIADFVICFNRVEDGKYTARKEDKLYGRIGKDTIMGWFSIYDEERDQAIAEHNQKSKDDKPYNLEFGPEETYKSRDDFYKKAMDAGEEANKAVGEGDITKSDKFRKIAVENAKNAPKFNSKEELDKYLRDKVDKLKENK